MSLSHLSALDAGFLYLETPEMPMHIGSLYVLKDRPDRERDYYDDFRAMMAERLHLAPVFTRKLQAMPFDLANPVWIEDEDIDLDYHVRRTVLPKPGSMQQLEALAGRLHSSLLDRSRPLWEFYVIEGLNTGELAFYSKVHHAGLDGQAGMKLAATLLDISAEGRKLRAAPPRHAAKRYQLGIGELLWSAGSNALTQSVKFARLLPNAARALAKSLATPDDEGRKGIRKIRNAFTLGPRTHFNVTITNQRSFGAVSLPLGEVKALGKKLDATINDMVMVLCAGALRRYLEDYDTLPKEPLVAGVPVSMRQEGDETQNNQVTMTAVPLATHIKDPLKRLEAIRKSSASSKAFINTMRDNMMLDFPSLGAPWLVTGLVNLFGRSRLADAMPPLANVVISNVPGPQVQLYMCGAEVRTMYPVSIPAHGTAINITVQSYNGKLDFGLTCCRRAVPDVRTITQYIAAALDELKEAAAQMSAGAPVIADGPANGVKAASGTHGTNGTNGHAPTPKTRARKTPKSGPSPRV